ncbi:hypothetical protein HDV00_011079 [Rhizophlyctis rosea]|nr:hypothetical protein HDV00_011079 [Rhizophlyctis rosea]
METPAPVVVALRLHWETVDGEQVLEVTPDSEKEESTEDEPGLVPGQPAGARYAVETRREPSETWTQKLYTSLKVAGRFVNPFWEWRDKNATNFWEYLHWQLTRVNRNGVPKDLKVLEETLPIFRPNFDILLKSRLTAPPPDLSSSWIAEPLPNADGSSSSGMAVTWLGQSTCVIQMDGYTVLTDPIFSDRTVSYFGPKRLRPSPCQLSDLPKIDIVLVSHNHYDHLDINVVKELGNTVKWYIPLGLRDWFAQFKITNVVELDWWEEHQHDDKLKVISTPIQHWSGRHFFDVNQTLWSSFVVKGPNSSFFHCGDTGYCSAFAEIGKRYGPITLAALPIGSYEPRWFLRHQHASPEEAVQMHRELRAQHTLGVHWGTFMMSDEYYMDPPRVLDESREKEGVTGREVFTTRLGETVVLPPPRGWRSFGEDLRGVGVAGMERGGSGSGSVVSVEEGEEGEGVLVNKPYVIHV